MLRKRVLALLNIRRQEFEALGRLAGRPGRGRHCCNACRAYPVAEAWGRGRVRGLCHSWRDAGGSRLWALMLGAWWWAQMLIGVYALVSLMFATTPVPLSRSSCGWPEPWDARTPHPCDFLVDPDSPSSLHVIPQDSLNVFLRYLYSHSNSSFPCSLSVLMLVIN